MKKARRSVVLAQQRLEITAFGERSEHILQALFRDSTSTGPGILRSCFRLEDLPNGCCSLTQDGTLIVDGTKFTTENTGLCALTLSSKAQYHLCNKCSTGMMLHAAAVRIDDQLIVLPGESGAGKTTLTANLLAAGAVYLTDELVFVDRKTGLADCLPRPLNIKQPGVGIVTPLLNPGWDDGTIIRSAAVTLLPHRLLNDSGEEYPQHAFRPAAIVFPNFADSARLMMEPLSSARACVRLMGCLVNARNLEKDGLDDCANLSRVVPAWRLNYSAGAAPLQLLREIRGDLRAS